MPQCPSRLRNSVPEDERKVLDANYYEPSTVDVRKKVADLLDTLIKDSEKAALSKHTYENSAWPYYQADNNGYKRAMKEVIDLLTKDLTK